MYRLSGMTDANNNTSVSNVSYNAANRLLTMNYPGANEARGYNVLNQLTTLSAGSENLTYNYPTGTNNGKVSSMYNAVSGETITYAYYYDSMSRPLQMTGHDGVNSATYDPANRLLGFSYLQSGNTVGQETRQYNSLEQLTQLTTYSGISHTYNYPTGANNGKISSAVVSGETISYAYDSLNRLMSASGSGWGENYGYDAFGSLLSKTITSGTPPSLSQAVNPLNNWIVGQNYDPNGNQLTAPGVTGSLTYDAENHMVAAPGIQYAYDSQNMRVWSGTLGSGGTLQTQTVYFYGADGHKLGSYAPAWAYNGGTPALSDSAIETESYFAGKRVAITSGSGAITSFSEDRLGSNAASNVSLYPWGEDRGTPGPNDQVKFATYTRDSATMLDYANQRYYVNNQGRFMTPDPYQATATSPSDPNNPQSWNRYAYVQGDPVNYKDPSGRLPICGDGLDVVFDSGGGYDGSFGGADCSSSNQGWGCDSVYVMAAFGGLQMPSPCYFTPVFFQPRPQVTQIPAELTVISTRWVPCSSVYGNGFRAQVTYQVDNQIGEPFAVGVLSVYEYIPTNVMDGKSGPGVGLVSFTKTNSQGQFTDPIWDCSPKPSTWSYTQSLALEGTLPSDISGFFPVRQQQNFVFQTWADGGKLTNGGDITIIVGQP